MTHPSRSMPCAPPASRWSVLVTPPTSMSLHHAWKPGPKWRSMSWPDKLSGSHNAAAKAFANLTLDAALRLGLGALADHGLGHPVRHFGVGVELHRAVASSRGHRTLVGHITEHLAKRHRRPHHLRVAAHP